MKRRQQGGAEVSMTAGAGPDDEGYLQTRRVLTWAREKLVSLAFIPAQVASLGDEKLERLIDGLHAESVSLGGVDTPAAERFGSMLRAAIRSEPGLVTLVEDPLILLVMAVIHMNGGELPDGRAVLCREAMDVLLWPLKDNGSATTPEMLLKEANSAPELLQTKLCRVAFLVHGTTRVRMNMATPTSRTSTGASCSKIWRRLGATFHRRIICGGAKLSPQNGRGASLTRLPRAVVCS